MEEHELESPSILISTLAFFDLGFGGVATVRSAFTGLAIKRSDLTGVAIKRSAFTDVALTLLAPASFLLGHCSLEGRVPQTNFSEKSNLRSCKTKASASPFRQLRVEASREEALLQGLVLPWTKTATTKFLNLWGSKPLRFEPHKPLAMRAPGRMRPPKYTSCAMNFYKSGEGGPTGTEPVVIIQ